jgi:hypothetical protein
MCLKTLKTKQVQVSLENDTLLWWDYSEWGSRCLTDAVKVSREFPYKGIHVSFWRPFALIKIQTTWLIFWPPLRIVPLQLWQEVCRSILGVRSLNLPSEPCHNYICLCVIVATMFCLGIWFGLILPCTCHPSSKRGQGCLVPGIDLIALSKL